MDSNTAATLPGVSENAVDLAFPNGSARNLGQPLQGFDSIDAALQDFRDGKFLVVLDNEDRENEGDLIIAAEAVCPLPLLPFVCSSSSFYYTPLLPSLVILTQ